MIISSFIHFLAYDTAFFLGTKKISIVCIYHILLIHLLKDTFTNVYWPFVLFLQNYLFISLAYLFNVLLILRLSLQYLALGFFMKSGYHSSIRYIASKYLHSADFSLCCAILIFK